jgi:hypothetical protein
VSLHAGDPLDVTLHVTNRGDATGDYDFGDNGCTRALVPPPDQICTANIQVMRVAPHASVDRVIPVDTHRATPGTYVVKFGTVSTTVVVVT